MLFAFLLALVGVVHVHHSPSHDSSAPFPEVLEGARAAGLDFLVLTEHVDSEVDVPLPALERAGVYDGNGEDPLLVMVGAELTTGDGHLLALAVPRAHGALGRPGREAIERIHAEGGFAVVPHPFSYGGWRDWGAPFDGMEVHNNASAMRRLLGPLLPLRLVHLALNRRSLMGRMLRRPARELDQWEELLSSGRRVVAISGAEAHRNVSILGWQLDPYDQMFRAVQTVCPDGPLTSDWIWSALRNGRCWIRYTLYEDRAAESVEVRFPSGRVELQLDSGDKVWEIRNPPPASRH
jgi:hypothetical protein